MAICAKHTGELGSPLVVSLGLCFPLYVLSPPTTMADPRAPTHVPHSALVLGFRGAHRKQEEQRQKLEKQMAQMEARQAEELARLEATAQALGNSQLRLQPPPLGETLL